MSAMEYSIKSLKGLEKRINVVVPVESFDSKYSKELDELCKKMKLNGFRSKKKLPAKTLERRFGKALRGDVIGRLIDENIREIFEKETLNPVAMPHVHVEEDEAGKPLKYHAVFEVFPEIKLVDLAKQKMKLPKAEISDADIDEALVRIQEQQMTWADVDRAAKKLDQIKINFVGTIDKEKFPGGSAEGYEVVLGKQMFLPEFEKHLVGKKAGDNTVFTIKFPKDYNAQDLAGKKAEFTVDVLAVREGTLPEINDDFAKKIGTKEGTVASLRDEVKVPLEQELERALNGVISVRLHDLIEAKHKVELPLALLKEEIARLAKIRRIEGEALEKLTPTSKDPLVKQARKNLTVGLVMREFASKNDLQVEEKDVIDHIKKLGMAYADEPGFLAWYMEDKARLQQAESAVYEEKLQKLLLEQLQTVDEVLTYAKVKELAQA